MRRIFATAVAFSMVACGGDPSSPSRPELAGTYVLTQLRFDPQGVLPQVDILDRLGGLAPRLVLAPAGDAQLIFEDPATNLITTVTGRYTTPQTGVRIDFGENPGYRNVLFSRRMTFANDVGASFTFDAEAPDGVPRARLLELVPEWTGEQLLDPVPGRLTVTFTRQ
jgi:hypothetical protein